MNKFFVASVLPKHLRLFRSVCSSRALLTGGAPVRAARYSTAVHCSRAISNMGPISLGRSPLSTSADADQLSTPDYHTHADRALDELQELLDSALESIDDDDIDIDYSQGVLNVGLGGKGHWVLNKQAPNKEIWWSSPISGPMRFRPIVGSAGQVVGGASDWTDVRGSGETLFCIFTKEIGSVLSIDLGHRQD